MAFSNKKQFESGNFNEWDKITKDFFPKVNKDVRQIIIPTLDKTLDSMLGINSEGTKKEINISIYKEKNIIDGVKINLIYIIDDFHVEDAPKDAVEQDVNSIKSVIENQKIKVESLTINTTTGELSIIIDIPVKEEQIEQA